MPKKIGEWLEDWETESPGTNPYFSVRNGKTFIPAKGMVKLEQIEQKYGFTRDMKLWRNFPPARKEELMAIGSMLVMLDEIDRNTSDLMMLTNKVSEDAKKLEQAIMKMEGGPEMMEALKIKFPTVMARRGTMYEV